MSEIERLYAAFARSLGDTFHRTAAPGETDAQLIARNGADAIRAVLTAMREPSEGMARAAGYTLEVSDSYAKVVWQAMLDHILAEPEGGA